LEIIARQMAPETSRQLDRDVGRVNQLVSDLRGDRAQITAASNEAANAADKLAHDLVTMKLDPAVSLKLIGSICAGSDRIAYQGERAAEQALMAVNSLFVAYSRNRKAGNHAQIRAAIGELFKQFDNPSAYNPQTFSRTLRELGTLVGGLT